MGKTRLDVVVWWREQQESKARRSLLEAKSVEDLAREKEELARQKLLVDHRGAGQASEWEMTEMARSANARKLKEAQVETKKAEVVTQQKREVHVGIARGLKAVENAAQHLRDEAAEEFRRKEAREFDELAMMLR